MSSTISIMFSNCLKKWKHKKVLLYGTRRRFGPRHRRRRRRLTYLTPPPPACLTSSWLSVSHAPPLSTSFFTSFPASGNSFFFSFFPKICSLTFDKSFPCPCWKICRQYSPYDSIRLMFRWELNYTPDISQFELSEHCVIPHMSDSEYLNTSAPTPHLLYITPVSIRPQAYVSHLFFPAY